MTPGRPFSSTADERGIYFLPRLEDRGGGSGAFSIIVLGFIFDSGSPFFVEEPTGFRGIDRGGVTALDDGRDVAGFGGTGEIARVIFDESPGPEGGGDVGGPGNCCVTGDV
jgi:hypothetical protein